MSAEERHREAPEINYDLLQRLSSKPHPLVNIVEGAQYGLMIDGEFDAACNGVGEAMQETRNAQHLCDLAGIPRGKGYASDTDSRVYLLMAKYLTLRALVDRIKGWHSRETGPGGMVGDFCTECGTKWPCDTRRMADGTYEED